MHKEAEGCLPYCLTPKVARASQGRPPGNASAEGGGMSIVKFKIGFSLEH